MVHTGDLVFECESGHNALPASTVKDLPLAEVESTRGYETEQTSRFLVKTRHFDQIISNTMMKLSATVAWLRLLSCLPLS